MKINPRAPEPANEQLAAIIRERIRDGTYPPRTAIPSITEIVAQTGLAIGTVRKAIGTLVGEGLVYTRPGHGTFVTGEEPRQSLPGGAPSQPH